MVSLARKVASTTVSDSVPQEKTDMYALPTAPHSASAAARAVCGKVLEGCVSA